MTTVPVFDRKKHFLQWIPISDLVVHWPEAQRLLSEKKAKDIAEIFDPDMFGTVTVSPLADGKYHVDDGWTRVSAARQRYGDKEKVPCTVVPADTERRAAEIFHQMNGRRSRPTSLEMFKTAVTAKFKDELGVTEICSRLGLKVSNSGAPGAIRACTALLSVYRQHGGDVLFETLNLIHATWGLDSTAYDAQIIRGMASFLVKSNETIDGVKFSKKLARKFTPGKLLASAKATREAFGDSMSLAVCALIHDAYDARGAAAARAA
jgi:hypothetical protein